MSKRFRVLINQRDLVYEIWCVMCWFNEGKTSINFSVSWSELFLIFKVKVKVLPKQATEAQRMSTGIALPFHDIGA